MIGEPIADNIASSDVPTETAKPVVLIPLSGGGFTSETKTLLDALHSDFAFIYLKAPWAGEPGEPGVPMGTFRDIPAFDSNTQPSVLKNAWAFVATFLAACQVLRRTRVDLVIGVGSRHAPPMLLAGRLFRKQTVFIESLARANRLSRTGALMYHLRVARTFIVQWPALQQLYPRSHLGTLL